MPDDIINLLPPPKKTERKEFVTNADLVALCKCFAAGQYAATSKEPVALEAMNKAVELMRLDYCLFTVDNSDGMFCAKYPSQLIMLEYQDTLDNDTIYESLYDSNVLRVLMAASRGARFFRVPLNLKVFDVSIAKLRFSLETFQNPEHFSFVSHNSEHGRLRVFYRKARTRIPMPVILYKGKYVVRSSTLTGELEQQFRKYVDFILNYQPRVLSLSDARKNDIDLLLNYNVHTIVDFMVEERKYKYYMSVTSSEKVQEETLYDAFTVLSLPYPGCEFFAKFHESDYNAEHLVFDWKQSFINVELTPPKEPFIDELNIDWKNYKNWDLITLTKHYLKVIIKYLEEKDSGILIHCISGWDRTPLFVSLIRLSLWADGLIHQHLNAMEIAYLTIAYDWMLFGHNLPNRKQKHEDIFVFCFYMLKYISSDEFNPTLLHRRNRRSNENLDRSSSSPRDKPSDRGINIPNIKKNESNSSACSKFPDLNNSMQELLVDDFEKLSVDNNNALDSPKYELNSPSSRRNRRTHTESTGSDCGSWTMVTGTGSIQNSFLHNYMSSREGSSNSREPEPKTETRQEKLFAVRKLVLAICAEDLQYFEYKRPSNWF